jgi:hypothetical protein
MKQRVKGSIITLTSSVLLGACVEGYEPSAADDAALLGSATQAAAACVGDDIKYDFNAFAASLAVAIADELERWDVNADFEVRNGKLELSATGTARCNAFPGGCTNIIAMLRLQDDAASAVPNHSPSVYRNKLVGWYNKQTTKLKEVVTQRLTVDKGVYKLKVKHTGKYMAVDNGSTTDGALIEQKSSVAYAGADEWRLILENTEHKFKNVRSGKCLTLSSDTQSDNTALVQRACSTSATTQNFEFASTGDTWAIRTKWWSALDISGGSTAEDARVVQNGWIGSKLSQQWQLVPVGTGQHIDPLVVATAVYSLTARHSGKAIAVDNGSLLDGALIEQGTYSSYDDRFQWYISPLNGGYQFTNRKSGKCLALASDSTTAALVQQTCSTAPTQTFSFRPVGDDGGLVIYSKGTRPLEVANKSTYNDARIAQAADGGWTDNRIFKLTPIFAGEPHRLTFSHTTNDATCGEYNFWYEITQPNGQSLRAPEDSYVQLMFAGGKETLTGKDVNPFIAQQVSGDLVAIDPTYGLNDMGTTTTGACSAACTKVTTVNVAGQCCSCNGATKTYKRSAWNTSTYLCQ